MVIADSDRHSVSMKTAVDLSWGLRTRQQQRRYMSMPAVATSPNSPDWFKKAQGPSIFEIFEKSQPTTRRTFQFAHAASAMPKNPKRRVALETADEFLSVQVGEDAYFMRSDAMGVADGVGGWSQYKGANPALYSRKLMHYASAEFEKLDDILDSDYSIDDYNNVDPREVMQQSYDQTNADMAAAKILGSTTAIVAVLRDDELRIANLGDCGVMIVRNDEPIFRSEEEQQHSFNFPYQLGTGSRDSPKDAQTFSVKIQEDDIVILGSDGMFDNVFDDDIVEIIRSVVQSSGTRNRTSVDPQKISDALLRRAREVAEDSRYASSPFQTRAIQEGMYYQGGKMDDVTVLAGVIRLSEDSPDRR
ncbi:phosphatase 2C-like domain-containing protein [Powellomyces hirtus]|nr:phosphatase 2C-like domain-containing protein [Powellomyces hirtus]